MFRLEKVSVLGRRAHCTCGWSGRDRWFRAFAAIEAWRHGGSTTHMPTVPLVLA